MRLVSRVIRTDKKAKPDGSEYVIYTYQLDDGHILTSLNKLEVGQRVEHFWSKKLDREVILPYGHKKDKTL